MSRARAWREALPVGAVAGALLLVAVVVLVSAGADLRTALSALWIGSLGSRYALLSATLVRATPLILLGLSVTLAFRAGVLNIGAEGQFIAGASAGGAVALATAAVLPGPVSLLVALTTGVVAGGVWAAVAAELRRRFGVLEVISTLMLNFIALYGVSYLVHGPLQEPTHVYPQSATLPMVARLPFVFDGQRLHVGFILAVLLGLALWYVFARTAAGFRIRVTGAGAAAAASAGAVNTARVSFLAFIASGAIAGGAGAVEVTGVTYTLFERISPGYGYSAIAVALLARLHPVAVIGAGVFFGALEAGAAAMQRDAGVPSQFASILEALAILGVLAVDRFRARRQEAAP